MEPTPNAADFEHRLAELKEVKLKLPLRHHVHLHSLKLIKNRSISELVANALDAYFAKNHVPAAGSGEQIPAAAGAQGFAVGPADIDGADA